MKTRLIAIVAVGICLALASCDSNESKSENRPAVPNANAAAGGAGRSDSSANGGRENVLEKLRQESNSSAGSMPPGHPAVGEGPQLPAGHPPIDDAAPDSGAATLNVKFSAPAEWKTRTPASTMRKYEYELPAANGAEAGELVVYFFGRGQGGSVKDNLERWRNQFKAADGKPVAAQDMKQENFSAGDWPVTMIEVGGEYLGMTMPGTPAPESGKPNYRMLAAVIGTPGGAWFVKATGPDATMAAERERIVAFVKSAKP